MITNPTIKTLAAPNIFGRLRLFATCHVPFDRFTQESMSEWIIKNRPVGEWEVAATKMARVSKSLVIMFPNALQELDWPTVHLIAERF